MHDSFPPQASYRFLKISRSSQWKRHHDSVALSVKSPCILPHVSQNRPDFVCYAVYPDVLPHVLCNIRIYFNCDYFPDVRLLACNCDRVSTDACKENHDDFSSLYLPCDPLSLRPLLRGKIRLPRVNL